MRTAPLAVLLITAVAGLAFDAGAATYKWVDKDGKVHYSDKKVEGAEEVQLKPITEMESSLVPQATPRSDGQPASDAVTSYHNLSMTSPTEGYILRGAGIGISFAADVDPSLGPGDRLEFVLDGKVVPAVMPYIDRGTHSVMVQVVGADGSVRKSSPSVSFEVFQNTAPPPAIPKPKK